MTESDRRDNFDHIVSNPLTDLVHIPGHHDFTPERLRFYRNGNRVHLQYGNDADYTETGSGRELSPDSGDTLTIQSSQRISYPVGFDLLPSAAWQTIGTPEAGDVIAGGLGNPDVDNFDPAAEEYTNSNADGYFWFITADTGTDEALFVEVRDGTILYKTRATLAKGTDVWSRFALWLNWYGVGPCRFIETYTDIVSDSTNPQENRPLAAVANDDGKGPLNGSKRIRFQIHQDSANTGLKLEVGSLGVSIPGRFEYIFKVKEHSTVYNVTNNTRGEYEVVGALRIDPARPLIYTRITGSEFIETPSTNTDADLMVIAADPDETNLGDGDFETPRERSEKNSVIEEVVDNSATGPDADAVGTDVTGAETAQSMTNPGAYQIANAKIRSQGTGSKTEQNTSGKTKSRDLHDIDWGLVLIDSSEIGEHEVDWSIAENQ